MSRRHPLEIMLWEREAMKVLKTNIKKFDVVERLIQEIPLATVRVEYGLTVWLNLIESYLTGSEEEKAGYIDEVTKIFNLYIENN